MPWGITWFFQRPESEPGCVMEDAVAGEDVFASATLPSIARVAFGLCLANAAHKRVTAQVEATSLITPSNLSNTFPHFLQALGRNRCRRAQFLREELHAQFFQHPAKLLDLRIAYALLGEQDGAPLVVGP